LHNAPFTLVDLHGNFATTVEVKGIIQPDAALPDDLKDNKLAYTLQNAGLLLYQDRNNFVQFERVGGVKVDEFAPIHRVELNVVRKGVRAMPAVSLDVRNGDVLLALVRQNARVRCMFSLDGGTTFLKFQDLDLDLPEKLKVGLTASNISDRQFTATFENFALLKDVEVIKSIFGDQNKQ
jgi:regulation of enolase protein 1 (concanavalin A-like superfamily)